MGSSKSSMGDFDSYAEEAKREEPRNLPPLPPPEQPDPQLEAELQSLVARAEEDKKREDELRDAALARQLDHDINAESKRAPGGFPEASGDAAQTRQKSARSSGGGGLFSGSDKYKEKYLHYKKQFEEMEQIAREWEHDARQHRTLANRHYQQLRVTQLELGSARRLAHHLDTELKAAKHELNAVKKRVSDAVNFSEVPGKELKSSPLKGKPVPQEDTTLLQEPPRAPNLGPEDESMGSPMSSLENFDSDAEEARREQLGNPPPLPPPEQPDPQLEAELQSLVTRAEEDKKREDELRDAALARQLDHDLDAEPKRVPGGFPRASGDAAPIHHKSTRSSGGGGLFSSGSDKYKEKYLHYKKQFEEMEQIAREWEHDARQHRTLANRHYQQLRVTQLELGSARRLAHHLDTELKAAKHELNAVKKRVSDAVNFSEVPGKELEGVKVDVRREEVVNVYDNSKDGV